MNAGVTERLLDHLRNQGASTAAQLARAAGLSDSGRVSAVLKTRIKSGMVIRTGKRWKLNPEWDDIVESELRDARILLERAGYRVVKA